MKENFKNTDEVFELIKVVILSISQFVICQSSVKEMQCIKPLMELLDWMDIIDKRKMYMLVS